MFYFIYSGDTSQITDKFNSDVLSKRIYNMITNT